LLLPLGFGHNAPNCYHIPVFAGKPAPGNDEIRMTNVEGMTKHECRTGDVCADLRGRRVTIMGLGRHGGGVAAARFCAQQGAVVTVTDLADERTLADSVTQLADVSISRIVLGAHDPNDFQTAEIVVVNPAVRPGNALVELARRNGAQISSETELFLNACSATVIGVTGTVGKSTTATMLADMLAASGRRAWLGGNIGHSLLADLLSISADDIVVIELSSFQLYWLNEMARWPRHAMVTNCSPNHLEWHGNWEHYVAAKRRLISHLPRDGVAVLNFDDSEVASWDSDWCGRAVRPSAEILVLLQPVGDHNRTNAALAAAMARAIGVDDASIDRALKSFAGLPHRLQFVAEISGRTFYDDSKSTTPAATIAALAAMSRPTWLLLGGAKQPVDWTDFPLAVVRRAQAAALFGSTAEILERELRNADPRFKLHRADSLAAALAWCWRHSAPGDAILLSPACASTDQFRDFVHRGEEFQRLVRRLAEPRRR
jgi:UDP-N-acetylmuramoylalanine--D-glutamate ligase